jgi:DNA modification methylase
MSMRIITGDCRDVLASLPDESVHCCVTSPPYWGLRDYGTAKWEGGDPACDHKGAPQQSQSSTLAGNGPGNGKPLSPQLQAMAVPYRCICGKCGARRIDAQIGLEAAWQEYVEQMVAVFREVRRVLRADGTCWANLGDSYATSVNGRSAADTKAVGKDDRTFRDKPFSTVQSILKPKDICGIPWRIAFALQEPYYTGCIKREADRAWLAALVDGEGCLGIRRQAASGNRNPAWNDTFIPYLTIKMSDRAPLDKAVAITGLGSVRAEEFRVGEDDRKVRTVRTPYLWRLDGNKAVQVARELYPYLLVKAPQAALIYTLDLSNKEKRRGRGNVVPADEIALRDRIFCMVKGFNQRQITELPDWCEAPDSLFEQGWWLRQDIIWSKPNPMPESVTDRCTKAHEYVFLLSKSERYYYDAEAIKEVGVNRASGTNHGADGMCAGYDGHRTRSNLAKGIGAKEFRNRRSVWEIATAPFSEAHFATFPPALIEPCILAGTSAKGCCAKCGAPWVRETGRDNQPEAYPDQKYDSSDPRFATHRNMGRRYQAQLNANPMKTLGWSPSCACDAAVVPCTVLDRAGTTGLVADRLQRDAILIELNQEYAAMAQRRIVDEAPLFARCGP